MADSEEIGLAAALKAMGSNIKEFDEYVSMLRTVHEIAQSQMILTIERGADLGVDPAVGLLALKFVVDRNLELNMEKGNINADKVKFCNSFSALLADDPEPKEVSFANGRFNEKHG